MFYKVVPGTFHINESNSVIRVLKSSLSNSPFTIKLYAICKNDGDFIGEHPSSFSLLAIPLQPCRNLSESWNDSKFGAIIRFE